MTTLRPTRLITHISEIARNFGVIRKYCPGPRMIAVVKADAYGHGALDVSRRLLKEGAWGLAVAAADEAVSLRDGGIDAPILVLGGAGEAELKEDVALGISQAVYSLESLSALQSAAEEYGRPAMAHLKIDTGMSRIGVRGEKALSEVLDYWISSCPAVEMRGIFTHYAAADTDPEFTARQKALFDRAYGIAASYGFRPMRHAAASTGIALGEDHWYDAVRPGIALYGAEVQRQFPGIRPAQTLATKPVRVEWIDAGDTVGYGRTFRADRPTRVMTLPIGYGDGYPRILGGRAQALVCGTRAPIIGRVCMDQMMLDVTDIPEANMNSEVVLMGR